MKHKGRYLDEIDKNDEVLVDKIDEHVAVNNRQGEKYNNFLHEIEKEEPELKEET